jgi:hypothetical protein
MAGAYESTKSALADIWSSVVEQPFKIPFAAAVVLVANTHKPEIAKEVLSRAGAAAQTHLENEAWREFKLHLRFLGLLQGLFEGEGVFPVLEDLFSRALDLQTASSEDVCLLLHPHFPPFLRLDWQKVSRWADDNMLLHHRLSA